MTWFLMLFLALIPVGEGFGEGSATAEQIGPDLISVDISVEIPNQSSGSVVVHLIEPGEEQQTVALRNRGSGMFGAVFESRQVDLVAVFESLGTVARQSEPFRLSELGVDRATLGMAPVRDSLVDVVDEPDDDKDQWGWLGLGFGAAALSLLAVWVLGGEDDDGGESDDDEVGDDGPPRESSLADST